MRRSRRLRRPRLTLASQILALHLGIIAVALVVGIVASIWVARQRLQDEYGHRALVIAESLAAEPAVRDSLLGTQPPGQASAVVQPVAESVRHASGATFVVVMTRAGIRLSHPDPTLVGQPVDDAGPALDGKPWIGSDNGALGPSVRAKAPVLGPDGAVVGVVSVGFHIDVVNAALSQEMPAVAITVGSALALAAMGSFLLARHVKRKTFGLEPTEIGHILEHREAILHGIREGTVAADMRGRVTLVNDEARDLLALDPDCIGEAVDTVLPPGRIRALLQGEPGQDDEIVTAGERVLVANQMPVVARGGRIGYVVTLRDRTELVGVLRELDSVRGLSDALRAQSHEFSNRLHTIAGLIELGRQDEALRLITADNTAQQELAQSLARRVQHPMLGALLLGKSIVAAERGIDLVLSDDSFVPVDLGDDRGLVTIVGNLVDNAFDAVSHPQVAGRRRVDVTILAEPPALRIDVGDSGPGIDPALGTAIFDAGVTSKDPSGTRRGLGLTLVRQAVERRGGVIDVATDHDGAVFRVRLPLGPQVTPAPVGAGAGAALR